MVISRKLLRAHQLIGPCMTAKLPAAMPGQLMQANTLVQWKSLEQSFFDHRPAAALVFSGGLRK